MDPAYIESVWWSLKQIFDKGLLVQDYRVAPYCPRCGTGLSDHELAQGYETVVDPSVYVRFPLTSGPLAGEAALLVWTTTPVDAGLQHRGRRPPRRHLRRRRPTATSSSSSPSRCSSQGARRGLGGHRRDVHRRARWSAGRYQRPFDLVDIPGRRTTSSSPTTSRPRTAPVWSTSPPRSARTTSRSAARTACRSSTRSAPTAPSSRGRPAGRRPVLQEGRRDAGRGPRSARGLLFKHVPVRAQLPALLALPHRAALLRAAVLVHPHHRRQGPAARRRTRRPTGSRTPSSTAASATG